MGMTMAIWKWRAGWPLRFPSRVMRAVCEDRAPFAITRFDAHAVADEIRQQFGEDDDAPFIVEVCDFTGHRANWILVQYGWSVPDDAVTKLVNMCAARGLHVRAD